MKRKKSEKSRAAKGSPLPLFAPVVTVIPPTKYAHTLKKWSGKWQGKSCVVYQIELPTLLCPESMHYLEKLRDEFSLFLKKCTETESEDLIFAGFRVLIEERTLILETALGPFSERRYQVRARILLDDDGAIQSITRIKKHT